MAEITKKDLTDALKHVATKTDIEGIEGSIKGLATKKDWEKVRDDIKSIHSDLIEHDKRSEKMLEHLAENQRIGIQLERMRENIKTKLGVEV